MRTNKTDRCQKHVSLILSVFPLTPWLRFDGFSSRCCPFEFTLRFIWVLKFRYNTPTAYYWRYENVKSQSIRRGWIVIIHLRFPTTFVSGNKRKTTTDGLKTLVRLKNNIYCVGFQFMFALSINPVASCACRACFISTITTAPINPWNQNKTYIKSCNSGRKMRHWIKKN